MTENQISRKQYLLNKFQKKRDNYFNNLATKSEKAEGIYNGDKYSELQNSGNLPQFCKIIDNLKNQNREQIKGNISQIPLYKFLTDVEERLEDIVTEDFYKYLEKDLEEESLEEYNFETTLYIALETKKDFINNLKSLLEERIFTQKSFNLEETPTLTQTRYNWLESEFANFTGYKRIKKINKFIDEIPRAFYDTFYWSCDNN